MTTIELKLNELSFLVLDLEAAGKNIADAHDALWQCCNAAKQALWILEADPESISMLVDTIDNIISNAKALLAN